MIACKPKTSTYLALSLVLIILFSGLIYILNHFYTVRSFGIIFYLFATVLLTLVILLLLVKMMASYKFISAGKSQIITRLPLRGKTKTYALDQVLVWEEEKITTNKRVFSQLTIVFDDKSSFTLSNHEHLNYDAFLDYLQKKLLKKRVDKMKKK
ncbi:MAG: hypothetical protein EA341_09770 [Mongoliibacter sp.]|uniref:hypothetical protein n=1 Tax=Mongoliibacter sp. TaxID=2022438 RepID=UPI0012F2D302|nr:hypothetical protein [Mongoliibacter sp.]TVP49139.1 MAG: hypothetical protein EA341_09770 [Mongoliibacter sp.]